MEHPMTTRMLVDMGLFPNIKKANRRLIRLTEKGHIHCFRSRAEIDGETYKVYFAGKMFGENMVQHHSEVTQIVLAFEEYECERWNLPHDVDAHLFSPHHSFYIENDTGKENDSRVKERVEKLKEATSPILWVCPNETRMKRMMKLTEPIKRNCFYATFPNAILRPHEEIWHYFDGTVVSMPRGDSPGED